MVIWGITVAWHGRYSEKNQSFQSMNRTKTTSKKTTAMAMITFKIVSSLIDKD